MCAFFLNLLQFVVFFSHVVSVAFCGYSLIRFLANMNSNSIRRITGQSMLLDWDNYDPMLNEWEFNLQYFANQPSYYLEQQQQHVDSQAATPQLPEEEQEEELDLVCYERLEDYDGDAESDTPPPLIPIDSQDWLQPPTRTTWLDRLRFMERMNALIDALTLEPERTFEPPETWTFCTVSGLPDYDCNHCQ